MPHTLCYIPGSGNSPEPALVARHTGQAREGGFELDRFPAVLPWMARVAAQPGDLAVDPLLPA